MSTQLLKERQYEDEIFRKSCTVPFLQFAHKFYTKISKFWFPWQQMSDFCVEKDYFLKHHRIHNFKEYLNKLLCILNFFFKILVTLESVFNFFFIEIKERFLHMSYLFQRVLYNLFHRGRSDTLRFHLCCPAYY
jgi:hypothetical protein